MQMSKYMNRVCVCVKLRAKKWQRHRHAGVSKARTYQTTYSHLYKLDPGKAYYHKRKKKDNIITGVKIKSQRRTEPGYSNVKLSSDAFIDSSFL